PLPIYSGRVKTKSPKRGPYLTCRVGIRTYQRVRRSGSAESAERITRENGQYANKNISPAVGPQKPVPGSPARDRDASGDETSVRAPPRRRRSRRVSSNLPPWWCRRVLKGLDMTD